MTQSLNSSEKIFIGIPSYGSFIADGVLPAALLASEKYQAYFTAHGLSLLAKSFNTLYCMALNSRKDGFTHFCLLHADIIPEAFWLDKMMAIMKRTGADVLSVVSPVKDPNQGFTSTALDEPIGDWSTDYRVRRLTLHELYHNYPATWTHTKLLVNSGLMLVDLRTDWAEKVYFNIKDWIIKCPKTGNFLAVGMSEDWDFSRQVKSHGGKLYVTREVKLEHLGNIKFSNAFPWGKAQKDSADV